MSISLKRLSVSCAPGLIVSATATSPLARSLGVLRLLYEVHDLGERGVRADSGGLKADAAAAIDRSGDHRVPSVLHDRNALACHERLVDAGLTLRNLSVHGHLVAGSQDHDVT